MRQLLYIALAAAFGLFIFCVFPLPTYAAFPGYNGQIVFYSSRDGNNEIYVMNADGTNQVRLTDDPGSDANPDWLPDGRIGFASTRSGTVQIYTMKPDGSQVMQLTNTPQSNSQPKWSRDGSKIVFTSIRDGNNEIYTMNPDGSNQVRLTNNAAQDTNANWSPDGTHISFASNRDGTTQLFIMDADGSNVRRVTNNLAYSNGGTIWSPDGQKILFNSLRNGFYNTYVINIDGSNETQLTFGPGNNYSGDWSPDGKKIAIISDRDGTATTNDRELYSMNADGSNIIRLTTNVGLDWEPRWKSIPNKAPIANNDALTTTVNSPATADVLANDSDEESLDASNLTLKTAPVHGTAIIKDGKIVYTPANNFIGSDSLIYQICDSFVLDPKCATATLGITVQAGSPPPLPSITSIGTVQLNGADKVYFTGHRPTFSGTAEPGSAITIVIHSDPITLTTTANSNGNWSVTPTVDIPNGEHQVIITATKDGATSQPLNLVLGINTGLAATGTPLWPLSIFGFLGLITSRILLTQHNRSTTALIKDY